MILIDTSVWIEFFRGSSRAGDLARMLEENEVLTHPWIVGELALGNLGPRRPRILSDLRRLPATEIVAESEILDFVESRRLYGRGIGWVDAQLIGSALVSEARFWSFDIQAALAATEMGVEAPDDGGQPT